MTSFHPPQTVQTRTDTPLGAVRLTATPRGLSGLWFEERQRHAPAWLAGAHPPPPTDDDHPVLQLAAAQLRQYFAGDRQAFDMPLDLAGGTAFQQAVWQALLHIEAGQSSTYGDLARQIGRSSAVRAVGAAVGRNPISVIVPCHRVLGADGRLTGYAGGLDRKAALLHLEGHPGHPSERQRELV